MLPWQRGLIARPLTDPLKTTATLILFSAFVLSEAVLPLQEGPQQKINSRHVEKKILDQILGGDYDSEIRPSGANGTGPTEVSGNLYIRLISKIDDYEMEYSMQITLRQQWLDDRLRFDKLEALTNLDAGELRYLTLKDPARIWMPDLFFSNEKQGHFHNLIKSNLYFRIHPDGEVLYSTRISLTLSCPMILKLYPLDKQTCSLRMASYGFTTEDLIFKWKKLDPVQVTSDLHLPRFALEQFTTDYCDSRTNTGTYSCLRVDLLLKREFNYYLIQIYIPSIMIVIVSWLSFWLDQSAMGERISLGVTTLLTIVTQNSGVNAGLPPVSYVKSIDVWTGTCLLFVFGPLLEYFFVHQTFRSELQREKVQQKKKQQELKQVELEEAAALPVGHPEDQTTAFGTEPIARHSHEALAVDGQGQCETHGDSINTRRMGKNMDV